MVVDASPIPFTENLDEKYAQSSALIGNRLQSSGPESYPYTFIDVPYTDADVSSHNVTSTDSTICHSSEIISDVDDHFSAMQHYVNTGDTIFDGQKSFNFRNFPSNKETATNTKDDVFSTEKACSSGRMVLNAEGGTGKGSVSEEVPVIDFDVKGQEFRCADRKYVSPICRNSHSNMDITPVEGNGSVQPFSYSHSHFSSKKQSVSVKNEGNDGLFVSRSMINGSVEPMDEVASRNSSYCGGGNSFPYKASRHPFTGLSPSLLSQKPVINAKEENEDMIFESKRARHCQEISDGSSARSSIDGGHLNLNFYDARQYFPCSQPSMLSRKQLDCTKDEIEAETKPRSMASHMSKLSPESIQSNSSDGKSHVDDDPDICILEDISQPAPPTNSLVLGKTLNINQPARSSHPVAFGKPTVSSQQYHCIDPSNYPGVPQTGFGGMRLRASDERLIFQVALQVSPTG